jgi:hypothetical protein
VYAVRIVAVAVDRGGGGGGVGVGVGVGGDHKDSGGGGGGFGGGGGGGSGGRRCRAVSAAATTMHTAPAPPPVPVVGNVADAVTDDAIAIQWTAYSSAIDDYRRQSDNELTIPNQVPVTTMLVQCVSAKHGFDGFSPAHRHCSEVEVRSATPCHATPFRVVVVVLRFIMQRHVTRPFRVAP